MNSTHPPGSAIRDRAGRPRRAVLLLLLCALATAAKAAPDIATPKSPWKLTFAMDDVTPRQHELKPGSDSASFNFTRKDGVSILVYIEPVKDCQAAEQCRDKLWKVLQPKLNGTERTTQGQLGEAYTIEILLPKERNLPVNAKTLYAEFVHEGYWIDMRLSKGGFKPEEQAKLEALVHTVRFEPKR